MSFDDVRVLASGGIFMLLVLLRLEAGRFGAAEFADPGEGRRGPLTQLSWYAIGLALLAALYVVHPAPHDVLYLLPGHRADVVDYGAILAGLGLVLALAMGWLRYGYLRPPAPRAYPMAVVNSLATAFIDEATYRGALIGALLWTGLPGGGVVILSTIAYLLVTRAAAPGRHYSVFVLATFYGLAGGWATVSSGGLGAAFVGHAVTSFALFAFTGHAGQMPRGGREPEELALRTAPPQGWVDVRLVPGAGANASAEAYPGVESSGFVSRADRWRTGHSESLLAWIASTGRAATERLSGERRSGQGIEARRVGRAAGGRAARHARSGSTGSTGSSPSAGPGSGDDQGLPPPASGDRTRR